MFKAMHSENPGLLAQCAATCVTVRAEKIIRNMRYPHLFSYLRVRPAGRAMQIDGERDPPLPRSCGMPLGPAAPGGSADPRATALASSAPLGAPGG